MLTNRRAQEMADFDRQESRRFNQARFEILEQHCRCYSKDKEKIILASRAITENAQWGFQMRLDDFDDLFYGRKVVEVESAGCLRKMAKIGDVQFFALVEESREDQVHRIFDLVAEDKKVEVLAELMARVGRKE